MSNTVITVQSEPSNAKPSIVDSVVNVNEASSNEISESEMRLVSSLAKLQKLEAMVHQLRDLLPDRLLDPMLPIVNPNAVAGRQVPKSPQMLYEQLSKAARAGVAEVKEFQSMWRAPEMKTIWELVDVRIKENGGQLLQPSGVWESDYDTLLEELVKEREKKNEEQRKSEEELERSRVQSTEGGWRAIVESFAMRNVPGVRVIPSKNEASIIVTLAKAGMSFKVHTIGEPQANNAPDWQVVNKAALGQPRSELEKAITDCLNARPRQWDLVYLLVS
ncbi:hypothetical protein EYZ11_010903 [Aspergillus tanneri]|uniref:Uncharacterized protein n=1 Tax=Aspergillus tanneri TaxID=1220188 RepID=A0A4S3J6D3_9EURO|nr:hypothetical protein EYZ11_010903 [Aspergillus tanneri]